MQLRKKPDANKLCQAFFAKFGAGDEARTRDLNLGKVALYQLSYSRLVFTKNVVLCEDQNYITTTRLHVKSTPSLA
jgi:hypothetical protein